MSEGDVLERAEEAGRAHAREQIEGDHFNDWVWEQMAEAEDMRRRDPDSVIPLETKADARRVAKNMLQQLRWDTDRQLDMRDLLSLVGDTEGETDRAVAKAFFEGFREVLHEPGVVEWLADEVLERRAEFGGESVVREATGGQPMSADAFASLMTSLAPADRQTTVRVEKPWNERDQASVYVNFVNLPPGIGAGAEAENNRASFWVHGFPHDRTAPAEKIKVEQSNSVFHRKVPFRAKTRSPDSVARHLAAYLAKVVETVPPNFTHTRVDESRRNDSRGLDREKRDLLDVLRDRGSVHPEMAGQLVDRYQKLGIGPSELRRRLDRGETPLEIAQMPKARHVARESGEWGIWNVARKRWMIDPLRGQVDQRPARYPTREEAERAADREWRKLNPGDEFEVRPLPALTGSSDRRWRYVVIPVTVHAGGRRESGRGEEITIDHADVAMQPHQILDQHGIPHYRWDYTDPTGRWIEVPINDFVDAVRALRSYGRVDPRTWAEKRGQVRAARREAARVNPRHRVKR